MPKVEIDYSNTIFYKIFCKDPVIKDLYVGLTTNFVQRKHAHKQSCKNEKALNHNCKLYNAIRSAGGWDNWQMEIIAFHNCADSYEARKKEQEYFEALGATLNSIDPFPKPKEPPAKIIKEKKILFCEPCNVHFSHWTTQETHNNTKKHAKLVALYTPPAMETNKYVQNILHKYMCEKCDYVCSKKSCWSQHLLTAKHKQANLGPVQANEGYICKACNIKFVHQSSYCRHRKKCLISENPSETDVKNNTTIDKDELISNIFTPKNADSLVCVESAFTCCKKNMKTNHSKSLQDYTSQNSLWYHAKKCNAKDTNEKSEDKNAAPDIKLLTNMVLEVVKKNQELMNQNLELQKHITNLYKKRNKQYSEQE